MYVRFLGAPISGKTTVAAQVFAELKKSGQPNVEFVAEQARFFIAEKKWNKQDTKLTDQDQEIILKRQMAAEQVMHNAVGDDGIVITDSSVFNSFLYMSDEFALKATDNPYIEEHMVTYGHPKNLLFLCSPLHVMTFPDANRVHSADEAKGIHTKLMDTLQGRYHPIFTTLNSVAIPLNGPTDFRANQVIRRIYEKLTE